MRTVRSMHRRAFTVQGYLIGAAIIFLILVVRRFYPEPPRRRAREPQPEWYHAYRCSWERRVAEFLFIAGLISMGREPLQADPHTKRLLLGAALIAFGYLLDSGASLER